VDIRDIAHSLACQSRFTGHTHEPLTTAGHSVHVSRLVAWLGGSRDEQLYGLIHDGGEAYFADIARPVKHAPQMENYRREEKKAASVVAAAFGLSPEEPVIVKQADDIMLAIEARDQMAPLDDSIWGGILDLIPTDCVISVAKPWPWRVAEKLFLARFRSLGGIIPGDIGVATSRAV
jgi:hypothetical protein